MRHASLFSGIGGFDLAAEWMGWENVFNCENKEFNKRILKYYWPEAISYDDIKTTDFTIHRGQIDILSGGFPCQPYSTAGKRKGKEDERHLWPEMLRAIREIQPQWVLGENVRGLINWNGGLVFDEVQADLEAEEYEVQPILLPAAGVNAIHERYRIWFVAYSNKVGLQRLGPGSEFIRDNQSTNVTHPNGIGLRKKGNWIRKSRFAHFQGPFNYWDNFPTQSPIYSRNDGFPLQLDGITFSSWRGKSIEGYGNAVVPHLVLQIFKAIGQYADA